MNAVDRSLVRSAIKKILPGILSSISNEVENFISDNGVTKIEDYDGEAYRIANVIKIKAGDNNYDIGFDFIIGARAEDFKDKIKL